MRFLYQEEKPILCIRPISVLYIKQMLDSFDETQYEIELFPT